MKKIFNIFIIAIIVLTAVSGCQNDNALIGNGAVNLKVAVNKTVDKVSRSTSTTDEENLAETCTLYVYNSKSLIRKYHGLAEVPNQLVLVSGDYKAVAWAGDSVSASYTAKYYKGEAPFAITKGNDTQVTIVCKIANVVASVALDQNVQELLSDYTVSIGNSKASLTFSPDNADAKGYYMMPAGDTSLNWSIKGTQTNGNVFEKEGVIENVKGATEYVLTLKYNESAEETGGAWIKVEVDESTIDVNEEIILKPAPRILGSGFDIAQPIYGEKGGFEKKNVYVTSAAALTKVELACDYFTTLGLQTSSFDFINMSADATSQVEALGITHEYTYNAEQDNAISKISFDTAFLNSLPNGTYPIVIKATDAEGKTTEKTFTVEVSDAWVVTSQINIAEVNVYSATIRGTIAKEGVTGCGFNYRKAGDSAWTTIAATVDGNSFYAKLTGLEESTTYEFVAMCDGFVAANIYQFTTGVALALTNGGFENWFTDSDDALVPSASSDQLFWDTGNHGSITLNVNITTQESTLKHSGNYAIKMQSAYVAFLGIGKFAAGNVFLGKYLDTDGTNGILGFGRPFAARPKALHGYVKYTPGAVDYTSSELSDFVKGQNDIGVVYIAMLDETTQSYDGSNWPFIIKTKSSDRSLFNKDASNVLGYGELIMNSATEGDGLVEFTIPIDYVSDKMPSNILIVGSASYYGDYFAGSTGSVMYLDDLELVYE